MPAYPFLFEVVAHARPNDKVVSLPPPFAPTAGILVATDEALDLVAYLIALDHTYPVTTAGSGASR
jgi:cytochrome c oxidase cbb3-type subunit 2